MELKGVPFLFAEPARRGESLCLQPLGFWRDECFYKGMTLTMIVLSLQIVVVLVSLLRERGEDERFEGDKLTFRS